MTQRGEGARRPQPVPVGAIILVVLGVVLLLQTTGVLPWPLWLELWRFWPILLIAAGAHMLLRGRSPVLAAVVVLGLLIVALVGAGGYAMAAEREEEVRVTRFVQPLDGLETVRAHVTFGAGVLEIGALPGDSANAVEADLRMPGPGARATLERRQDNSADLRIRPEGRGRWFDGWFRGWFGDRGPIEWEVLLSGGPSTALEVNAGAADVRVDLRDLRVTVLDLSTGAANVEAVMPAAAGHVDATISAGASNINVVIPEGVAARITRSAGLSSLDIDTARFPATNGVHQSPDYDTAENRINLDLRVGAASVTVR